MEKRKGSLRDSMDSWKKLIRFYRKVQIPWIFIILTAAMSLLVKQADVWMASYNTSIMTGAVTATGFVQSFLGMTLLYDIISTVQESINDFGNIITTRNVSRNVWGKMLHLPVSFYRGDSQGLVSRITQDTTGAYGAVTAIVQLVAVIYGLYINFMQMYRVYHALALMMLSAIPLTLLASWVVGKLQYKVSYITNSSISIITNFFGERMPNIAYIKTCGTEEEEYQKGLAASEARYRAEVKQEGYFIFIGPIGTMAQYINEIILLVVASALVRNGTLKLYQMVSLYNYFLLFMANAFMITGVWQCIKQSHGACETISRIMDAAPEDMEGGALLDKESEDIVFDGVSYAYSQDRPVLQNVSFTIPKGKRTVIVGENGSGKSTIVRLLERFDEPGSGEIRLGERKLTDVNLTQWRDAVGYLFQGVQIIKGSIEENISYGCGRSYTQEELEQAAKMAGAYDFIMDKDDGFATQISNFDARVSGGEMQRLAIARILLKNPRYLILDEATSSIDAITAAEVLESLTAAMEGRTVLMIAHDMSLIRQADHIIVLRDGCVEASGSFAEVAKTSELLREFQQSESRQNNHE